MRKKFYLHLLSLLLLLALSSCKDNHHDYAMVGTVYSYSEPQAEKFNFEGCRIIHSKKEYKKVTETSLKDGWDIDFDNNVLALVRSRSNHGITNVEVQESLTTDNGYHIKVWIEQNLTDYACPWAVAIVMKKAPKEEIHLDVKYSLEDNEPHGY